MKEKLQEMSVRGETQRGETAAWGGAGHLRPVAAATARRRPLRILIVGPSLDPPGGQAVQAAPLLEHLPQDASLEVSFLPINPRLPGVWGKAQAVKYVRTVVTMILYRSEEHTSELQSPYVISYA